MKQINNTTFVSDNLGDLKPLVTIGGKPVDKFIPNLNMSFHNDEFFINLNRRDKQAISTTDKAEIDGIDKDIFYIDENGRFKWDIEFKERPSKNSWTWELKHADGIEFYYQGELTDEEIKDGCERPHEVVGSYAVYCNKANNKYKTGKLCHIYRPFCYDINAESIYADLKIADGQLTITIDETWLDNATFPVTLDPTFGYETIGGSTANWVNSKAVKAYTLPSGGGSIESISLYCYKLYGDVTSYFGLYADNSGYPGSRLAYNATGITISSTTAWRTCPVSYSDIVASAQYFLAFTGNIFFYYDSCDSGAVGELFTSYNASLSDPFGSFDGKSQRASIYATYTESGGSALPAIINNYRQQGVM